MTRRAGGMASARRQPLLRGGAALLAALLLVPACAGDGGSGGDAPKESAMPQGRNHLGSEKSPYLLQHKDNPVWWHAWGEEAFAEARQRGVPVFLSVGYSTCHWCHVMEHECFEDEEVADYLNQHFVSIKVDREERPDIDAIYMEAVHALRRRGGWPMSVFLTADGKPFFGGTYFPKPQFLGLLRQIQGIWTTRREDLEADAQRLMQVLESSQARERSGSLEEELFSGFLQTMEREFDPVYGGSRGAPKFPASDDLRLLLRLHRRGAGASALRMVRKTLDEMAAGGIYDHLGGGFARYSTDERWLIPHFEKMLYDQASLTQAYLEAWQVTGEEEYALVVRETIDYVLRAMTGPQGAFLSAEDADSDGEEGKFYAWSLAELKQTLGEEPFAAFAKEFDVSEGGNFEHGTNVLSLRDGHTRKGRSDAVRAAMRKLFELREKRIHPHLDDKVLTDWNGLMIAAMARAGRYLGEPRYVAAATRATEFLATRLRDEKGGLLHRYRDGEASIRGFLEDYAYFIDALIEVYQANHDPRWLALATELQQRQEKLFSRENGDYATTDGADPTVLLRRGEATDNVRPAGRSVAAMNLLRLADLTLDEKLAARAAKVFASTPDFVSRAPQAFSHLLLALDYAIDRSKEVAVVGNPRDEGTQALLRALDAGFQPNMVLAVGPPAEADSEAPVLLRGKPLIHGKPTVYVCENRVCRRPTTDPAEAARAAGSFRPLGGEPEKTGP